MGSTHFFLIGDEQRHVRELRFIPYEYPRRRNRVQRKQPQNEVADILVCHQQFCKRHTRTLMPELRLSR